MSIWHSNLCNKAYLFQICFLCFPFCIVHLDFKTLHPKGNIIIYIIVVVILLLTSLLLLLYYYNYYYYYSIISIFIIVITSTQQICIHRIIAYIFEFKLEIKNNSFMNLSSIAAFHNAVRNSGVAHNTDHWSSTLCTSRVTWSRIFPGAAYHPSPGR